jgi:acetyl esterase/lipase
MDIYLPANRSTATTKVIVLIHGGGWNSGSKNEFTPYIDTFKKRLPDYAIFNVDYRVVKNNKNLFPTPENDIKAAVNFISDRAEEYGVNTNKMVLLGFSAGGHLALLQAYKNSDPVKPKAVVSFFAPTDLVTMFNSPWHYLVPLALQSVTGATPSSNSELYMQSSPAYFVNAQSPPTLILHGSADFVVHVSQSEILKGKLEQAGVEHQLVVYPNTGHGWFGSKLTDSFNKIEAFLAAVVN